MKCIMKDWVGILIGLTLTLLLWSFVQSQRPVVRVLTTPKNPIVVYSGRPFTLCRKVEYLRDTKMEMSKALIKNKSDGSIVTLNFPTVSFSRKKGVQTICRTMVMPQGISLGLWELHTYLSATYPPFWHQDGEAPVVPLYVSVYPQELK